MFSYGLAVSSARGAKFWSPDKLAPLFWAGLLQPSSGRLWLDAGGTAPVTVPGEVVGRLASAHGAMNATQTTGGARPTLVRWPKGGRRNLTGLHNTPAALNGTITSMGPGDFVLTSTVAERCRATVAGYAFTAGNSYTISCEMTSTDGTLQYCGLCWYNDAPTKTALFNSDGVLVASEGAPSYTSTPMGDGWHRISISTSALASGLNHTSAWFCASDGTVSNGPRALVGSKIRLRNLQVEAGTAPTPYQQVVSNFDASEAGKPSVWHLFDDGGDSLPAVLPTGAMYLAFCDYLGTASYASVSSDGTTPTDLLRAERMGDVVVMGRDYTSAEKAALARYWARKFAV